MASWGIRPNELRDTRTAAMVPWVLTGVEDPYVARTLALGFSPALYNNLYRSDIQLRYLGAEIFNCDVIYGPIDRREPVAGEYNWTFDTTGQTKHITQGLDAAQSYGVPGGGATIDHKGAIGVTDDGAVEGVDVPDRAFRWSETHQLLLASFAWDYSSVLGAYTGFVNTGAFRGKAAGMVRFDGAVGGQSSRDPDMLELTYHFAYSADESGIQIGDIGPVSKPGWYYLWTRYEEAVDDVAIKGTPKPKQVDVLPVHPTVDFDVFGIGS